MVHLPWEASGDGADVGRPAESRQTPLGRVTDRVGREVRRGVAVHSSRRVQRAAVYAFGRLGAPGQGARSQCRRAARDGTRAVTLEPPSAPSSLNFGVGIAPSASFYSIESLE